MKAWRTLCGVGFGSLVALGCTVTSGSDDDDDDVTITDDVDEADDTADDAATDDAADDAANDAADDAANDAADDVDTDSGADDAPADDDEPLPFECNPDSADACEACMATSCCEERTACAGSNDCVTEWTAIKACVDGKDLADSADPAGELQECMADAAPNGSIPELSDEVLDLLFCVGSPVEAQPDAGAGADAGFGDGPLPGDGTCTDACFGVFSIQPVE